ncbi:MAG: PD40 domain-containing protein, partial [Candidatus Eisenbacteria bacterium]|nr:PD40 domain-containing protein [Candidatus Eisenbacteria bacterium]
MGSTPVVATVRSGSSLDPPSADLARDAAGGTSLRAPSFLDDEPRFYTAGSDSGGASLLKNATASDWNINEAHGPADTVRFETDDLTWVSVDVHPQGDRLVFDVLGDLYTLPIAGGTATRITSGPAYDDQPRWSPDGSRILFTSDRGGGDDIWMMKADGSDLRPVTQDLGHEVNCGAWCSDGDYVLAKKRLTDFSSIGTTELWLYSIYGGEGIQITKKDELPEINEPVCSPDGRFFYFSARHSRYQYNRNVLQGIYQIERYDRRTGERSAVTDGYGGAGRPTLSPDGKLLAFVRRDRLRTVLYVYDLATRTERPVWNGLSGDMQENFANTGTYPGMCFTPDNRAVVLWAEGKLWSVEVASGRPTQIPCRVPVELSITKALRFEREIAPDSVRIHQVAWPTQSPDGKRVLFAAVGNLWEMPIERDARGRSRGGVPRRLATEGGLAFSPAYSRDGRWIDYVSWSDTEGGQVWKMPAAGGRSTRLTRAASQYANPAFSPDGTKIVCTRGTNAPMRGHDLGAEGSLDIVWIPAEGGDAQYVLSIPSRGTASRMPRPRWNAAGDRVYYIQDETSGIENEKVMLYSVRLDGTDRQAHLQLKWADDIIPSPDGKWAAYNELHNAYVTALPFAGRDPIVVNGGSGPVPMQQFTEDGGAWLGWADGGRTVTWSSGPDFYRLPVDSLFAVWGRAQLEAGKKKTEPPKKEADGDDSKDGGKIGDDEQNQGDGSGASGDAVGSDGAAGETSTAEDVSKKDEKGGKDDEKDGKDDAAKIHPDTLVVRLELPRAKPHGTVAFTGGRIITMHGDDVIEHGTLVIRDDRIVAVGPSESVAIPADARVFD